MDSFSIKVALCRGALATGAPLRLRIRGTSMVPTLWSGDSVSVHRATLADVQPGEIVVFARNRHFITHRVVRCPPGEDGVVVVTRGDAQPDEDPPVASTELLGVVTAVRRSGRSRPLHRRPPLLAHGVSWIVQRSSLVRSMLDRLNSARVDRMSSAQPAPEPPAFRGRG